jgi:hypothetical protein
MIPVVEDRWRVRKEAAGAVVFKSDPYIDPEEGERMELRLTYEGPLLSPGDDIRPAPSRNEHKHTIRKALHPQLKLFWTIHPWLRHLAKATWRGPLVENYADGHPKKSVIEELAERYTRANGYRYVPLVREELDLLCSVEVLYLRPTKPGAIIRARGDIDNKLKTLFDALSVPSGNQLPAAAPDRTKTRSSCCWRTTS